MTDDEQDVIHLEEIRAPIKIPKELKDIKSRFWIVGTWHWLDAERNFVEKVIRWSWPFDLEAIVADLFEASVSADYSGLPTSKDILGPSEFKSITEFASSNLGLDQAEVARLDRMTLEGLENDWVFEIARDGCISDRWLLAGMASVKKQKNGLNSASMRKKDMSKTKASDDEIVDQTQQVVQDPNSIQAKILELSALIVESDGVKSIKNGGLTSFAECDLAESALDVVSKRIELVSRYLLESRISIANKWISDNLMPREDVAKLYEMVRPSTSKEGTTTINNDLDLRSTEVRVAVKKVRDIFFKGRKFANLVCTKVTFFGDHDGRDNLLMSFCDLEVDQTATLVLAIPIAGSVKVDSSSSSRSSHDLVKGGVHVWLKNEGYSWRGADDIIFYNCYDIGKMVDAFKNSFGDKHPLAIWKYRDKFRRWSIGDVDQDLCADRFGYYDRYRINGGFHIYSSFNF